jgi:hypothetical protein
MREAYLGDEPCRAAAVAGTIVAVRPARLTLTVRALRRLAFVGAILLALATIARGLTARADTGTQNGHAPAATTHQIEPGSSSGDIRPGSHSGHRWHKRFPKVPKGIVANDPSDDGTASDPEDDDDASDDLNCDDDTDTPIVACISGVALYFLACKTSSTPCPAETRSPLFLMLQRLRC